MKYSGYCILSLLFLFVSLASLEASVSMGPQFFIRVKVLDVGPRTVTDSAGKSVINNYIEFEVIKLESGFTERFAPGDTRLVKIHKRSNPLFRKDDILIIGVEIGSTMSPTGPFEFVSYGPVKDTSGREILSHLF